MSAKPPYGIDSVNTTVPGSGADTVSTMSYWLRDGAVDAGSIRRRKIVHHVVGHQHGAVVEFDAGPQLEGPRLDVRG